MSAFSDLIDEARKLGLQTLTFAVRLNGAMGKPGETPDPNEEVWRVTENDAGFMFASGRTGEEALRRLVAAEKARRGLPP